MGGVVLARSWRSSRGGEVEVEVEVEVGLGGRGGWAGATAGDDAVSGRVMAAVSGSGRARGTADSTSAPARVLATGWAAGSRGAGRCAVRGSASERRSSSSSCRGDDEPCCPVGRAGGECGSVGQCGSSVAEGGSTERKEVGWSWRSCSAWRGTRSIGRLASSPPPPPPPRRKGWCSRCGHARRRSGRFVSRPPRKEAKSLDMCGGKVTSCPRRGAHV